MKRVSNATQEAVAEIMIELIMLLNTTEPTTLKELNYIINKNIKLYKLEEDPFTRLPCSTKEYVKNSLEYDRQTMVDKYGHHDGI